MDPKQERGEPGRKRLTLVKKLTFHGSDDDRVSEWFPVTDALRGGAAIEVVTVDLDGGSVAATLEATYDEEGSGGVTDFVAASLGSLAPGVLLHCFAPERERRMRVRLKCLMGRASVVSVSLLGMAA